MKTPIEQLQDCLDIQCSDGNWNYDPYMHGMANGMILAMALLKNEEPKYLDEPKEWLCDKNTDSSPHTLTKDKMEGI